MAIISKGVVTVGVCGDPKASSLEPNARVSADKRTGIPAASTADAHALSLASASTIAS
jgi:hypothetical protein